MTSSVELTELRNQEIVFTNVYHLRVLLFSVNKANASVINFLLSKLEEKKTSTLTTHRKEVDFTRRKCKVYKNIHMN